LYEQEYSYNEDHYKDKPKAAIRNINGNSAFKIKNYKQYNLYYKENFKAKIL
ncbi:11924_t:CDS:1, partial [Gigaspora margarita]